MRGRWRQYFLHKILILYHCYLCNIELDDSRVSTEHIIQNSLGGMWKSKKLVCRSCNKLVGSHLDSSVINLADFFCIKYQIKRDRGKVKFARGFEVGTGRKVKLYFDQSFTYDDYIVVNHKPGILNIQSDTEERVLNEAKRILKDKFQKIISIEKGVLNIDLKSEVETVLNFEGPLFIRAITKSIINFYIASGGDANQVISGIEFLKKDYPISAFVTQMSISTNHFNSDPLHIIIVRGDKSTRTICGYFEVFGFIGVVAILNFKYLGDDFQLDYVFDPISKNSYPLNIEFKFDINSILIRLYDINSAQ